ncbi:hypothetical protein [Aeromonas bivalvium]|uniref:hypothetical protein n=1 Tax=Aeromonas bivalvium TaxID=440079 RepID=UPI0038CF76F6
MTSINRRAGYLALLCTLWLATPRAGAATLFTHVSPESPQDQRTRYEQDLLRLALEETRADFGEYQLALAPPMNRVRLLQQLAQNSYPNLIASHAWLSPSKRPHLGHVRFPITLGMLSYRVCFVNEGRQADFSQVRTLAALRTFRQVQGRGWQDALVLRHAGMQVQEVDDYERLFRLVARGRANLFCRGAGEVYQEWQRRQAMPGLALDSKIALSYPNPHLFYSHEANGAALTRVQTGLERAWRKGSLQRLWRQHFQPALDLVQPQRRHVLVLDNPYLEGIDFDYQAYFHRRIGEEAASPHGDQEQKKAP